MSLSASVAAVRQLDSGLPVNIQTDPRYSRGTRRCSCFRAAVERASPISRRRGIRRRQASQPLLSAVRTSSSQARQHLSFGTSGTGFIRSPVSSSDDSVVYHPPYCLQRQHRHQARVAAAQYSSFANGVMVQQLLGLPFHPYRSATAAVNELLLCLVPGERFASTFL